MQQDEAMEMNERTEHNLERFLEAQQWDFAVALQELRRGRKQSHWIWYIFPQVAGLGQSVISQKYAIRSKSEAVAYLQHEVLGDRLRQCTAALLAHKGKNIDDIMGYPDNLKLRSSMTLFAAISPPDSLFAQVLEQFYAGSRDEKTLAFIERNP